MLDDAFWRVSLFEEVDSTNTRIKERIAEGAPEGTCFAVHKQTAAYGRQGRSWASPAGGLYFSFILDPLNAATKRTIAPEDLPSLSLVVSLGVQAALASYTRSESIRIKWPNDILVVSGMRFGKLCGISLELIKGKVCCGVGINVFHPAGSQTEEARESDAFRYERAYLEDVRPSFADEQSAAAATKAVPTKTASAETTPASALFDLLLPELLHAIRLVYEQWLEEGIAPLVKRYDQLLFNRGQQVALETIEGKLVCEGEVLGVSLTGELLLRTKEGAIVPANSGEVHTRF